MKEVPQMRASMISRNQASAGVSVFSCAGVRNVLINLRVREFRSLRNRDHYRFQLNCKDKRS
jgi:hypothetical protein